MDEDTKKLQEAYFEVITSEASYLRSINILITHFMAAPEMLGKFFNSFPEILQEINKGMLDAYFNKFPGSKRPSSVISNEERKQLFSNIFAVRDCSEKLESPC